MKCKRDGGECGVGGYCDECPLRQDVQRPVDSLVMRLRAMARHEHDDLSVADEAADRIEAMQAWQPIDTAPTDGTHVLLFCERATVKITGGYYSDHPHDHCWIAGGYMRKGKQKPTHWMPLPDAPC